MVEFLRTPAQAAWPGLLYCSARGLATVLGIGGLTIHSSRRRFAARLNSGVSAYGSGKSGYRRSYGNRRSFGGVPSSLDRLVGSVVLKHAKRGKAIFHVHMPSSDFRDYYACWRASHSAPNGRYVGRTGIACKWQQKFGKCNLCSIRARDSNCLPCCWTLLFRICPAQVAA